MLGVGEAHGGLGAHRRPFIGARPDGQVAAVSELQVIGGGKMGQALLSGMIAAGWAEPSELSVVEVVAEQREALAELLPDVEVRSTQQPDLDTLLAVKPHLVLEVAAALVRPRRVVSVAAGITTAAIEAVVPEATPVIRVMPNTPALVGLGASALAPGAAASVDDLSWAEGLLGSVGTAVVVTEAQLDAVTGLSGSGPAYLFLVAEALADAGVAAGLPRPIAERLANQTVHGAGVMLSTGTSAAELRAAVTTPAGTTAAGLRVLEERAVRSALIDAVQAAADRSAELGRS